MLYAKSDPEQSIYEHTNNLLMRLEKLKGLYGENINKLVLEDKIDDFWETLFLACKYHDCGKAYTPFQNIILEKLGKKKIDTDFNYEIVKHEQLSPLFIPKNKLNISKEYIKILYQSILFHHNRYEIIPDEKYFDYIEKIAKLEIEPMLEYICEELKIDKIDELNTFYTTNLNLQNRINSRSKFEFRKIYLQYILIKGLLNRLDHSASAGVEIEIKSEKSISELTELYMNNSNFELNDIQTFCKERVDKNILVVGSTGIGKTESALLWSGNSKSFFTLPLVVSINAIYDRIKEKIKYEDVGILHATSLDYIQYKEDENSIEIYEISKNFASPFTVCTIDQIFTFVFKYKGFEKIYSTLAYSKVIIDEIQAYSPHIVAVILKGIKMIHEIGGKFMIMTATLPTIYKDYLIDSGIDFEEGEFIKEINRHRVMSIEKEIEDEIENILKLGKKSKVLIIVNTVNKAIEVYENMSINKDVNINLLHARFTKEDKSILEEEIKNFSGSEENGIWITTQIVEASLDISFDYLFTELSTLDSLFQRMGRCYRNKEYKGELSNIFVYFKNVSGIGEHSVYNPEIHEKSKELLKHYKGEFLEEKEKVAMVKRLYEKDNIVNTNFYKEFLKSLELLENLPDNDVDKKEAQNMLRQIQSIKVIPRKLYDKNYQLFDKYKFEEDYVKKRSIKKQIEKISINVRKSQVIQYISKFDIIDDFYIVDLDYNSKTGLKIDKKDNSIKIDDRML